MKKKRNKYGNIKTTVDGIKFDSKREAAVYCDLKLLIRAGEISQLELQPSFDLLVNGVKIGKYKADFSFFDNQTKQLRYIDVKGVETAIFRRSKKHVKAQYGIDVEVWK